MIKKIIIYLLIFMMLFTTVLPITNSINMNSMIPDLVYSPTYHDFGSVEEGETYQTTFEIWNGGTDILTWNLGIVHTWISPLPTSGSSTGEHDIVTVTIDTTGMSSGSHTGFVSISANDGGDLRYFNIDLYINDPPSTPTQLDGPSSGLVGEPLYFTSSSIDPNGDDIQYGLDYNDDESTDFWGSFHPSGVIYTLSITSDSPGTFNLRLKARDEYGAESGWSIPKTVVITGTSNNKPLTPIIISGPTLGNIHISYTFSTSTTDPDDDDVKYGWDWDGDDTIDEWTDFYHSGDICYLSHTWLSTGTYEIKVKAQDEHGLISDWSEPLVIMITENNAPFKPELNGPTFGRIGTSYTYFASSIDPDNDQLYYLIDWGDGNNSGWLGPYDSGLSVSHSHIWYSEGTYSIKVKVKDVYDLESPWSDPLYISMPKLKKFDFYFFSIMRLLEKLSNII